MGDIMIHYIYKSKYNDVTICEDGSVSRTEDSLNRVLNHLCMKQFSSLEGMHKAMKSQMGFVAKIPLYLGPNTLLFPLKGLRGEESLYLNYFAIKSIHALSEKVCIITFASMHEMKCNSRNALSNQIMKCEKILSYTRNGFQR